MPSTIPAKPAVSLAGFGACRRKRCPNHARHNPLSCLSGAVAPLSRQTRCEFGGSGKRFGTGKRPAKRSRLRTYSAYKLGMRLHCMRPWLAWSPPFSEPSACQSRSPKPALGRWARVKVQAPGSPAGGIPAVDVSKMLRLWLCSALLLHGRGTICACA